MTIYAQSIKNGQFVKGFTLIELMIVVAIVAILAAIAVPSYQFAMVKSRRSVAQGCLTEAAQFMERYYTTNLTYANATLANCSESSNATYYTLVLSNNTSTAYTVTTTPQGTQASRDKDCGTMTMDAAGQKTASKPGKCW